MSESSATSGHLMIMAGGTGGHVFPALAVANALRENQTTITWLGTRRGLEANVVPEHGIKIEWISIEGLRGKGWFSWIAAPINILRAVYQSIKAIRKTNPDCVLGMGGFVSGPGGLAARLIGKPLVVHEQNTVAGLTNKYLAKIAQRVLTGFPDTIDLPKSSVWVGNPVRKSIKASKVPPSPDSTIKLLIIGGSQGALSLNRYLPRILSKQTTELEVWHQTGRGRSQQVIDAYATNKMEAKVNEFIDDMASAYAWADLLICRAGAMTISECCASGKPALLIPYPFSAGDHQDRNAEFMAKVGAAEILSNDTLCEADKIPELAALLSDKSQLEKMGQKALGLHKANALEDVVSVCQEFLNA